MIDKGVAAAPPVAIRTDSVAFLTQVEPGPVQHALLLLAPAEPTSFPSSNGKEGAVPEAFPPPSDARAADGSSATPQAIDRLWEALPFDLTTLEDGVERFFDRLGAMGDPLNGAEVRWELAYWLVAGAITAVAVETARRQWQQREEPRNPAFSNGPGDGFPS